LGDGKGVVKKVLFELCLNYIKKADIHLGRYISDRGKRMYKLIAWQAVLLNIALSRR
jgi:hypothetical protein